MMAFTPLVRALAERKVRYLLIGVAGANFYAHAAGVVFTVERRELLVPRDPENLLHAWQSCESAGLELVGSGEPLDRPRDLDLAERVVRRSALTRALGAADLQIDLTLVMAGFEFEAVWPARTTFTFEGAEVPVARLRHIVESKAAVGRHKDQLFLATHEENLRQLLGPDKG
ncbi:MAG: hypothetical protein IT459_09770 [Planctomycetes bacterium]|nr:hypothetical protein [Planctomycetota bacterium]